MAVLIQPSEVAAIAIAIDELEAYVSAVGDADPDVAKISHVVLLLRGVVQRSMALKLGTS